MADILVLNGPNLNLLGKREPEIYGSLTLADIEAEMRAALSAKAPGLSLDFMQTNREYEMIERIHLTREDGTKFAIINPGAWTHTSVAIRDAFLSAELSFVEVHLSNIHKREEFRHHSYLSDIADGVICGLGHVGYIGALDYAISKIGK